MQESGLFCLRLSWGVIVTCTNNIRQEAHASQHGRQEVTQRCLLEGLLVQLPRLPLRRRRSLLLKKKKWMERDCRKHLPPILMTLLVIRLL